LGGVGRKVCQIPTGKSGDNIHTKFNSKDKQNRESTEPENTYPIQKKSEHQRLGREFETDLAKKKEIDLKNRA